MYLVFAVLSAAAPLLDATAHPERVWGLSVWLAIVAALHLTREAPSIGDPFNHVSLACVSVSVAAAFVVTQPSGGLAVGGAMFIAPLVSTRLSDRRQIAAHVGLASGLLLAVCVSGVLADVVTLTTVFCAGLLMFAVPVLAVSCTAVLEAAEAQGRELERVVRRDALTGVGNRRLFEEQLRLEAARHLRLGTQLGVLVVELDAFSALHLGDPYEADELLKRVATRIVGSLPAAGTVARLDDGEFAIVLPDTSPLQARNAATAVQRDLAAISSGDDGQPAARVGWAALPEDATDVGVLVATADARIRRPETTRASCAATAQEDRRRAGSP